MASGPVLRPIGVVESELTDLDTAPKQGDEGAPAAWLRFDPDIADGLRDLEVGDDVIVLTWLDRARRDVLTTHLRGDPDAGEVGVFSTRSPHRPNPIGLHRVRIVEVGENHIRVTPLEAIDGTPVLDLKPVVGAGSR